MGKSSRCTASAKLARLTTCSAGTTLWRGDVQNPNSCTPTASKTNIAAPTRPFGLSRLSTSPAATTIPKIAGRKYRLTIAVCANLAAAKPTIGKTMRPKTNTRLAPEATGEPFGSERCEAIGKSVVNTATKAAPTKAMAHAGATPRYQAYISGKARDETGAKKCGPQCCLICISSGQ